MESIISNAPVILVNDDIDVNHEKDFSKKENNEGIVIF